MTDNHQAIDSTTTQSSSPTEQSSGTSVGETSSGLPTVGEVANDLTTNPFDSMGQDFDSLPETLDVAPVKSEAKPAVQAQAPVAPPVVAQPIVQPPVVSATPTQEQLAAAARGEQVQDSSQAAQPADIHAIINQLGGDTGDILSRIAPAFALNEEQITALELDASAEVPKLLAQTYMRAVTTSLQYMRELMPQMMQQYQNDQQIHQSAETEFFQKYPQLNRSAHGKDIITYSQAFAQANPNLTREQLFSLVGTSVMSKNGIVPIAAKPATIRPQAFSPASSSAPIISQSPVNENPFQGLGMEFE